MNARAVQVRLERTLERSCYRSVPEVLERYGVPFCRLYRWRERAEPRFPPAIPVGYGREGYFQFLSLVRWEIAMQRRSRRRRQVLQ